MLILNNRKSLCLFNGNDNDIMTIRIIIIIMKMMLPMMVMTTTTFLSIYKSINESLEERNVPWKDEPQESVCVAFSNPPKLSRVFT